MPDVSPPLDQLATLLRRRLQIIADQELRVRDPQAQLAALSEVSQAIEEEHVRLKNELPARLRHYMAQASYQKALAYLEGAEA
jgi:hypothetical protein